MYGQTPFNLRAALKVFFSPQGANLGVALGNAVIGEV